MIPKKVFTKNFLFTFRKVYIYYLVCQHTEFSIDLIFFNENSLVQNKETDNKEFSIIYDFPIARARIAGCTKPTTKLLLFDFLELILIWKDQSTNGISLFDFEFRFVKTERCLMRITPVEASLILLLPQVFHIVVFIHVKYYYM